MDFKVQKTNVTGFILLPAEILGEIVLNFRDPKDFFSLMLVNKFCNDVFKTPTFQGSKNIEFCIGLSSTHFEDSEKEDDNDLIGLGSGGVAEMFREMQNSRYQNFTSPKKQKKQFGMKEDTISKHIFGHITLPQFHFVRKVKIIEKGKYLDSTRLSSVISLFPRIIGIKMQSLRNVNNSFFTNNNNTFQLQSLDITNCQQINHKIFALPCLSNHLKDLSISGNIIIKSIENAKEEPVVLNKLERLVINGSTIQPLKFPNSYFQLDKLKTLELNRISFGKPKTEPSVSEKYFIEYLFPTLKTLKISPAWTYDGMEHISVRMLENIRNSKIEEMDLPDLSDIHFLGFQNIKKLRLTGAVFSKTTKKVFEYMPSLKILDLTNFDGVLLYDYDFKKEELKEESYNFLSNLEVLKTCCGSNIVKILRERGNSNFKMNRCGCLEYNKAQKNVIGSFTEQKPKALEFTNKDLLVHFFCDKCRKGCENCRKIEFCPKLSLGECSWCERSVCCSSQCEKCGRSFCGCVKMKRGMPICGETCEDEIICNFCFRETKRCENCFRSLVCSKCSSRCSTCGKDVCNESCIKTYNLTEDEDEITIPREQRICKMCKE